MFIYKKATDYKSHVYNPLVALLWKYSITRAHRYCHSFWEIFGGISVFLILFFIYQTTLEGHIGDNKRIYRPKSIDSVTKVFYRPSNNFTDSLMRRVEEYFNDEESDVYPKQQWEFKQAKSPVDLNLFNTSHSGIVEVHFKNNESFSPNLEYTIRANSIQAKNKLNEGFNSFFLSFTPTENVAPQHLGTLQWAIDKAYIQQLTAQNVSQMVQMIEIPKYISEELKSLHKFIILCTIVAPLPFFLSYSAGLIEERRSGLRELMKLAGVCSDVLRFSHILETTLVGILYAISVTIILKITSEPILPHSNLFLIALTIVQHFVNTMALAFVTTALSQDFHHADCLGFLLYMSTFILDFIWYSYKEYSVAMNLLCCVLPHAPIYLYWDEVLYLETVGVGSQLSNIYTKHSDNCMSVSRVWLIFYIQLAVITTTAWYLDLVRPGHYGVSKKWNFMFKSSFWCSKKIRRIILDPDYLVKKKPDQGSKYFERGPRKAEMAIQVYNVSKIFKQNEGKSEVVALNSVTFDCYKGEVTMLLGPNGAGKTTLMLIVAGMFSASEGIVYVNGMDVADKVNELREDVGLCMQENICFRYLTVRENITFFKKLRRKPKEGFTVDQLLKKLKLTDVADYYSKQLSSGTCRCLQVACVLAGDANVLVLDEPTTGMDVDVRHGLWDLIMVLRGQKTILMTTSCLEEANALGDRIVILNNGALKCHGTPTFLKHAIGTSFNLSITTQESTHITDVKEIVESIIMEPNSTTHGAKRITFTLPCKEYRKFPELFRALEAKKEEFGIDRMDVGMFMEEVFSNFIETSEREYITSDTDRSFRHFTRKKYSGLRLTLRQIMLLQTRVFQYFLVKKYQFLVLRVIVPILCIIIITLTTNHVLRFDKMFSHQISGPSYDMPRQLVYNVGPFRRSALYDGMGKFPGVMPVYSLDIERDFNDPSAGYMSDETVGFKITDNYTKIFHPLNPRRISQSVNMFSNMYMAIFLPYLKNNIRTTYEPLVDLTLGDVQVPKSTFLCLKWTSWVTFLAILPLTPIIILCIKEKKGGIRDNHMMAGCSPFVHWGSKLLAHMVMFTVIIAIPVIVIAVALDFDSTFQQARYLGSVLALLLMFGLAFLTQLYLLSFVLHECLAISQIYITSIFFGIVLPILLAVLEPSWRSSIFVAIPYLMVSALGRVSPMCALGAGLARVTLRARHNAYCALNSRLCPDLVGDDNTFDTDHCCNSPLLEPFPYLASYDSGLFDFINLLVHFLLFGSLVILLEYRIPQYAYEQFSKAHYKQPEDMFHDEHVKREKTYVNTMIRAKNYEDDILLVKDLHKEYALELKRKETRNGVRGVTFAAKLGQCLAILGPQATGKSTVLNMLAGNLAMTRGKSLLQGQHIRINRLQYIHRISLTSSAGGLDGFMTGHQNLMFIAKLKGYSENKAHSMSAMALRYMGLHENDTVVSAYSSGCRRRLSLCNTMILAPTVAFLDEPMREMDEFCKPLVAKALQRLMLEPAAVVVAETGVDWRVLQSVITRIAIMSKGQFAAIGPAEEILQSVAKGYTARIKLKLVTAYRKDKYRVFAQDDESSDSDSEDDVAMHSEKSLVYAQRVVDYKTEFLKMFTNSRLTGEHLSMLYFYIQDDDNTQLYSELFAQLQKFKEKFDDVVEDYYLRSTTIEDVFWRLEHEKEAQNISIT